MIDILVCFNSGNWLITPINATLEDSKKYYIDNVFNGDVAKFVLDINKPFDMMVRGVDYNFRQFKFIQINHNLQSDFRVEIEEIKTGERSRVEVGWFFKHDKRIIKQ